MALLGIDIRDTDTLAVLVESDGRVIARGSQAGPAASAVAAAVRAALDGGAVPERVGAARTDPGATDTGAILAAAGVTKAAATLSPGGAIALGEQWCGAARGQQHVVALSLGDGIHAGIVVGGRLFGGAHGLAGAAGWLALNPVEREDYRKLGCLEAEVGGAGIVRRLVWRIKAGDRSRVLDMAGGNINAITVRQVFEGARTNDGVAISVVRDTAKYIGMAVANLVAIVDPEIVVLGGAIAEADDLLLEPTRVELARRLSPAAAQQVSVVPAALGEASAAVGAARAAQLAGP